MLQSCDDRFAPMLEATVGTNSSYARRHGYSYQQVIGNLSPVPDTGNFNRYYLLRQEIDREAHDWALWLDADAIVIDHQIRLESIIDRSPAKMLIACRGSLHGDHDVNNGVFLLNLRHRQAREMIDACIGYCESLDRRSKGFHDDQHVMQAWLMTQRDDTGRVPSVQCYAGAEYNLFNYDGAFIRHVLREFGEFQQRVRRLQTLAGQVRAVEKPTRDAAENVDRGFREGASRVVQPSKGGPGSFQDEFGILVCTPAAYGKAPPSSQWLIDSCRRYDIELTLLGQGQPYSNNRQKIGLVADHLRRHPEYRYVLMVDYRDVIFCATLREMFSKYRSFGHDIVASAQRNNWPLPSHRELAPPTGTSFRYLNSGSIFATAESWLQAWDRMQERETQLNGEPPEQGYQGRNILNSDQAAWSDLYVRGQADIVLDSHCQLFQVLDLV
ncbi:MAG: hypothetical protein JJ992_21610, partial [Planctomycetes bacterium]|nr:hypothetical protein [Planctomycetota bacterium]